MAEYAPERLNQGVYAPRWACEVTDSGQSKALSIVGSMLTTVTTTLSVYTTVQNSIALVESVAAALQVLADPSALQKEIVDFQDAVDSAAKSGGRFARQMTQEGLDDASSVLRKNLTRLLRNSARFKRAILTQLVLDKAGDRTVLVYLPTPEPNTFGKARNIPTGLRVPLPKVGTRPLHVVMGGGGGRLFGLGVGKGKDENNNNQIFRMDWHDPHGGGAKECVPPWASPGQLGPYHFHIQGPCG